jgi:hypothetical protein
MGFSGMSPSPGYHTPAAMGYSHISALVAEALSDALVTITANDISVEKASTNVRIYFIFLPPFLSRNKIATRFYEPDKVINLAIK